jgi:hypothetical protein
VPTADPMRIAEFLFGRFYWALSIAGVFPSEASKSLAPVSETSVISGKVDFFWRIAKCELPSAAFSAIVNNELESGVNAAGQLEFCRCPGSSCNQPKQF